MQAKMNGGFNLNDNVHFEGDGNRFEVVWRLSVRRLSTLPGTSVAVKTI